MMATSVTLPSCVHCHRAVYPTAKGWVHATGLSYCYNARGDKLTCEPRVRAS